MSTQRFSWLHVIKIKKYVSSKKCSKIKARDHDIFTDLNIKIYSIFSKFSQ